MFQSSVRAETRRSLRGRELLVCLAMATLLAVAAGGSRLSGAPQDLPAITRYGQFWTAPEREVERPLHLEFVVLFYDPAWRTMWVSVDGATGFLPTIDRLPIRSRDRVRVDGVVAPARGLSAAKLTFTILEHDAPVEVLDAVGKLDEAQRLDSHLVQCEALLDYQRVVGNDHVQLELVAEGLRLHAYLWEENARLLDLPDGAILRLTGLYIGKEDPVTGAVEIDLWVAGRTDISIAGNLANDRRFAAPRYPIGELLKVFGQSRDEAHVAGAVFSVTPGHELVLRDHSGQITVRTPQHLAVQIGDVVEAVGRPFTGATDWILADAWVRRTSSSLENEVRREMATPPSTLLLADHVLELDPMQAAEGRPVSLTGVVLWSSKQSDVLWLRDPSGSVLVHLPPETDRSVLETGAGVIMTGQTLSGTFAPAVRAEHFYRWGTALLPEAHPVAYEQAISGREEGRRVAMRGYVREVRREGAFARIILSDARGVFSAIVEDEISADRLTGSIASIEGVCRAVTNARRQIAGIEIYVATGADIRVAQPAPADPFAIAPRRIGALREFNGASQQEHWARVRGTVTYQEPGRFVFIEDDSSGLLVLTEHVEALAPGDIIEACGLPGWDGDRIVLRESLVRRTGKSSPLQPISLERPDTHDEGLDSRFVRIEGRLTSSSVGRGEILLTLQNHDTAFTATLPESGLLHTFPRLLPGSLLDLMGVYEIVRDERREPAGFRLLLRSSDDIVVRSTPSWWTPGRAFAVTGALGGVVLFGVGWVALLKHRVNVQTTLMRRQLEKEAALEARNSEIVANASDFIFTTDLDGRITAINPAGERMTGYSRAEAFDLCLHTLFPPDDASRTLAFTAVPTMGAENLAGSRFETRLRTRDGRSVWAEMSTRVLHDHGVPTGVLGVVRDMSERKVVEEELRRARDAAESNTRAKSAFLANMSHEIRTPMNGVIGMSNLLLETPLAEDQREFAETIRNSAEALLTVLNDILDFSKIEAGKLQFEFVDFDLIECIDDTLELIAARAAAKRLELAALVPPDLPCLLRGDPGRLRQVLLNLVGNAVKFTERGEIIVHVALIADEGEAVWLRFEVRDTGIGMSDDQRQRLFQPFTQADASTTRRFGGTGLGLAICRQIVELMHGRIGVDSTLGDGSTFWFEVPLPKQKVTASQAEPPARECLSGLHVLAVDDHGTNLRLIEFYAAAWKLRCTTALSPSAAFEAVRTAREAGHPFQLILLDMHMPEMDGVMVAQELRGPSLRVEAPILLLTSLDQRFTPRDLQCAGIENVLTKPIRQKDLRRAMIKATTPASTAASDLEPPPASNVVANDAAQPTAGMRVLVVEDNQVNQRLVQLQLKRFGCVVDIASNGFEALEAVERVNYDVVLMDCQMPEMDGYEATRRLRESEKHTGLFVVALTANAMEGDREKCLEAGMSDYLSKPIRVEELRALLAARHAARSTAGAALR